MSTDYLVLAQEHHRTWNEVVCFQLPCPLDENASSHVYHLV